jgi:hypothetical protein
MLPRRDAKLAGVFFSPPHLLRSNAGVLERAEEDKTPTIKIAPLMSAF